MHEPPEASNRHDRNGSCAIDYGNVSDHSSCKGTCLEVAVCLRAYAFAYTKSSSYSSFRLNQCQFASISALPSPMTTMTITSPCYFTSLLCTLHRHHRHHRRRHHRHRHQTLCAVKERGWESSSLSSRHSWSWQMREQIS